MALCILALFAATAAAPPTQTETINPYYAVIMGEFAIAPQNEAARYFSNTVTRLIWLPKL